MPGCLPMGIGDNCTIRHCIVDKNARIGSDVQIVNMEGVQESNREDDGYVIKARAGEHCTPLPHSPFVYFVCEACLTLSQQYRTCTASRAFTAEHESRKPLV